MPPGTETDEFVHVEKGLGPNGRIAVVRFDRGVKANPLSTEAMRQLRRAAESFEDDLQTSVVILTGNGSALSSGADLEDARPATSSIAERIHRQRNGPKMCLAWEQMEQVTIAAIEGFAIGGGAALAVSLEFRFCGRRPISGSRKWKWG